MSRMPRHVLPGCPQHVIQRGTDRCPIFRSGKDFEFFLASLREACRTCRCLVHAYVLMNNHVHLIMTPELEDSLPRTMQIVGTSYVQYFNTEHSRIGALWQGRYKAASIETDRYLLACYRYAELNPVRANMVARPGDYPWSSYRANAVGMRDDLLTPHAVYLALGRDAAAREMAYRQLFDMPFDPGTLRNIRRASRKGRALGSGVFRKKIDQLTKRRRPPCTAAKTPSASKERQ